MSTIFSLPFDYYFWITNNNGLDKWGNSIRRDTKQSIESLKHSDKESKTKSTRFVPKHVLVHLNFLSALMRNDTTRQEKNLSFHSTVRKWKRDKITRFWYVPKCVLVHVDFLSAQDTRNIYQIIYSLPLVIVPSQLDVFFMKIHTLMKKFTMEIDKRKHFQDIFIDTL